METYIEILVLMELTFQTHIGQTGELNDFSR